MGTGVAAAAQGQPESVANAQAADPSSTEPPAGYHGKPMQVFSDEKQAELLKTAMK